jgi:hypothetical protein
MTVLTTKNRNDYTGNGVQTTYAYEFKIWTKTQLKVYVADVLKTVDVHYTVTPEEAQMPAESGGNVVFGALYIPANGQSIVLQRLMSYTQELDLQEGGVVSAETLEIALDKTEMQIQQLKNDLDAMIMDEFIPPLAITAGGTGGLTAAEALQNLATDGGLAVSKLIATDANKFFQSITLGTGLSLSGDDLSVGAGSDTQIQFNDGGSALGADSLFVWDKTNHRLGIGLTPSYTLDVKNGLFRQLWDANQNWSIDGAPWWGSYWTTHKAANVLKVENAEVLAVDGTSIDFRSALTIIAKDSDTTNYETYDNKYHAVHGLFVHMVGGASDTNCYKNLIGIHSLARGKNPWSQNNVSSYFGEAIQYSAGVCDNELWVHNLGVQSVSIAGLQVIINADVADVDSTHKAWGLMVKNIGKKINAAFFAETSTAEGEAGTYLIGLDMQYATIATGGMAIKMPASTSSSEGTVIEYAPTDYTSYDRANNRFCFIIGGSYAGYIAADGWHNGAPA